MKTNNVLKAAATAAGVLVLGTSPALALTVQIPEPSAITIYGAAIAGLIIAGRWMRRK